MTQPRDPATPEEATPTSPQAHPGVHPRQGQAFSPRTLAAAAAEDADQPLLVQRAVPIGRPVSQALYDHLKEEAETAAPASSAAAGQQDTTAAP